MQWLPYHPACAEMQEHARKVDMPDDVYKALRGLSERQKELFVWVPGLSDPGPYASDFFKEILEALRKRDWAGVLGLISRN